MRKKGIIIGVIAGIVLIVGIIVVAAVAIINSEPKVEISFETANNIPSGELRRTRERLVKVIRDNTADFNEEKTYRGVASDYMEDIVDDLTTAEFIVDFDEIQESYKVSVTWPDPNDGSPNVIIACALLDGKYPETPCTTEVNSSTDILNYLPYTGVLDSGKEYELIPQYDGDEFYIEISVSSCGDLEILKETLNAVREFVTSINFDPDDYLFYELTNICDDEENINESFYFQANRSETNDENVNQNLPYFVPSSARVFPIVDGNNNVQSIQIRLAGCTDYQTDSTEQWILDYLNIHGINYPIESEYCAS